MPGEQYPNYYYISNISTDVIDSNALGFWCGYSVRCIKD